MGILTIKRTQEESCEKLGDGPKTQPHIVVIGWPNWQSIVRNFLIEIFKSIQPIVETPNFLEVENQLGQLEPNLVIVTNYQLGLDLTLEKILALVPPEHVVIMCDKFTVDKARSKGVNVTATKDKLPQNLLPIVWDILKTQGY